MKRIILVLTMSVFLTSCYRDVKYTKKVAPEYLESLGYKIIQYDGYNGGVAGGYVWYVVKDSSGFVYSLAIQEWRGELHIYNQKCLNAVSNK